MDNKLYSKVFGWLFIGLLLTFGTGFVLANYPYGVAKILSGTSYIVVIAIELVVAVVFSLRIHKMKKGTAIFCYLLYSFITGVTFSVLFLAFELGSLMFIFLITAIVFGLFAFFGMVTKMDLTKLGTILFMGLIAILLASVINIFVGNETFDLILCIVGIVIFIGYIAYDMKKLPVLFDQLGSDKGAIFGAFQLYLDFINLFLRLLQLFGRGDRD